MSYGSNKPVTGISSVHFYNGYWLPHIGTGLVFTLYTETKTCTPTFLPGPVLQSTSLFLNSPTADGTKREGVSTKYVPGGWTQKGDASTFLLHKETEHLLSHQHSAKPLNMCTQMSFPSKQILVVTSTVTTVRGGERYNQHEVFQNPDWWPQNSWVQLNKYKEEKCRALIHFPIPEPRGCIFLLMHKSSRPSPSTCSHNRAIPWHRSWVHSRTPWLVQQLQPLRKQPLQCQKNSTLSAPAAGSTVDPCPSLVCLVFCSLTPDGLPR